MKEGKKIDRRAFLKTATGAAASVVVFPYVVLSSVLGAEAPSNKITLGCIGVGSQGTSNMNGFLSKSDARVVAVCDVDRRRLAQAKRTVDEKYGNRDCATYHDFRELIARSDIDALSLAVPDHWHAIPVIAGARAGKDMYGEKPLARTIHEGKLMVEAVERYNRIWQTGSWQRSQERFRRACELVINGRVGKVGMVEVGLPTGGGSGNPPVSPVPEGLDWDFWLGPAPWRSFIRYSDQAPHWDWRWIMDYSGGQLTDWAGHHIDIAHWGLGLDRTGPVEVEGKGEFPRDGIYDVPTAYKFTCKYANDLTMVVANDQQLPHGMGTCWYGAKGWIHVNRSGLWAEPASILDEVIGANETHLYDSRDHTQNFLDCVKTRNETVTPIDIAYRSITVGHLGEIAMLLGRKVQWDPDKLEFVSDDAATRLMSRPMRGPWHL
ncbi:MAG: Gfo/Idh/MocA family oxidoreductase [Sedimentisphaerales bacterium]|nr:Gfo/Idh/MocA family oxidoreductase [Sedimentisphaerales bacterium]